MNHEKPASAIVADFEYSLSRLATEIDEVDNFLQLLEFFRAAGAELDTLTADFSHLPALEESQFSSLYRSIAVFGNRLRALLGDLQISGFREELGAAEQTWFLPPDEQVRVSLRLADVFPTFVVLTCLSRVPLNDRDRLGLLELFASACEATPELLLLLAPDDRLRLAALKRDPGTRIDAPSHLPDGRPIIVYAVRAALRAHEVDLHGAATRGVLEGDIDALSRAVDLAEDIVLFFEDTTIQGRWDRNFESLDDATNFASLLYSALLWPQFELFRLREEVVGVVPTHDRDIPAYVFELPVFDFVSHLTRSDRQQEYAVNPLIFTLIYAHERVAGNTVTVAKRMGARLQILRDELQVESAVRRALESPMSHSAAVGLVTWFVTSSMGITDPSGSAVAAVTDYIVESWFRHLRV